MTKIRKCICCDFDIEQIHIPLKSEESWGGMWRDGIVEKISAGYGSSLDGDMFVIALCDICIAQKLSEGTIEYVGNYMFPDSWKGGDRRSPK